VKDALRRRLEQVADRHAEVERLLADPQLLGRSDRFRELSLEFARLDPVARGVARLQERERQLEAAGAMAADADAGVRELARLEIGELERAIAADEAALQDLLVPEDPLDGHNVFLEIRAAAGGDEAALFAGNLFRMYSRYAERRGWTVELLSESRGEHGGYREVVSRIAGREVYARLKFESGTHRVQRVPETEAQGRIHTSTCTVAVLPEVAEVESVAVNPADLRVDTAASTSTRPTRPCASRTCRPASWSSARTSARSTRTARGRWRCCARSCWPPSASAPPPPARARGACRSGPATARSASAPTTSRRAGSPTTAST